MPNFRVKILKNKSPVCKFEQDMEVNYQCCSGMGAICSTRSITILPKCFALQNMVARKKVASEETFAPRKSGETGLEVMKEAKAYLPIHPGTKTLVMSWKA